MHKYLFIFTLLIFIISGCSKTGSGDSQSNETAKNLDNLAKEIIEEFYFKNLTISVENEDGLVYKFISFSENNIVDILVPFSNSPYTELTIEYLNISSNANIGLSTGDKFPVSNNSATLKLKSLNGSDKYYFINLHPQQNNKNELLTLGLSFNLTGENENFIAQTGTNNIITLPHRYEKLMQNLSTVQTFISTITTSLNSVSEYKIKDIFQLYNGFGIIQIISQSGLINNEVIKIEYEPTQDSSKQIELMELEITYDGTVYNLIGDVATSEISFTFPFYHDIVKNDLGNIILKQFQISDNANGFLNINEILVVDDNFKLPILIKGDDDTSKYYQLKLKNSEYAENLIFDMKILLNLSNHQFITLTSSTTDDKVIFSYPARYIEILEVDEINANIFSYKLSPKAKILDPLNYELNFIRTKSSTEDSTARTTPTFSSTVVIISETGTEKTYKITLQENIHHFFVSSIQLKLNHKNKIYYIYGSIQGTLITFMIDDYDIELNNIKTAFINKLNVTDKATSELSINDQVNFSNTKANLTIKSLANNEKNYELKLIKTLNFNNDITKIDFTIEVNNEPIETQSVVDGTLIYIFSNDNGVNIEDPQELTLTSISHSNFATLEYQVNDKINFENTQTTFSISSETKVEKKYHLVLKKHFEIQQMLLDDNSLSIENMIEIKTINANNIYYLIASSIDAVGFSVFRLDENGRLTNTYNKSFKTFDNPNEFYSVVYFKSQNLDFLMTSTKDLNYIFSFEHQIGNMNEIHSFRSSEIMHNLNSYTSNTNQYYIIGENYNQTLDATQKYSAISFSIQYDNGLFNIEQSNQSILYSEKKPNTPLIDYFNQIPLQIVQTQFGKFAIQSYTTYTNDGTQDYFDETLLNLNLEDYNFDLYKNKNYLNFTTNISLSNTSLNKSSHITTPLHFKLNSRDYIIFDNKSDEQFYIYQFVSSYFLNKMSSYKYLEQGMNRASKIIYIKEKPYLITFANNSTHMQFFKINDDLSLELLAYDKNSPFFSFVRTVDFYESNGEIYIYTGNKAGTLAVLKINQKFTTP